MLGDAAEELWMEKGRPFTPLPEFISSTKLKASGDFDKWPFHHARQSLWQISICLVLSEKDSMPLFPVYPLLGFLGLV